MSCCQIKSTVVAAAVCLAGLPFNDHLLVCNFRPPPATDLPPIAAPTRSHTHARQPQRHKTLTLLACSLEYGPLPRLQSVPRIRCCPPSCPCCLRGLCHLLNLRELCLSHAGHAFVRHSGAPRRAPEVGSGLAFSPFFSQVSLDLAGLPTQGFLCFDGNSLSHTLVCVGVGEWVFLCWLFGRNSPQLTAEC